MIAGIDQSCSQKLQLLQECLESMGKADDSTGFWQRFALRSSLFPAVLLVVSGLSIGAEPSERDQLQLFIDDEFVESKDGLTRTLHQPQDIDANPVIVPEHPWEHRRIPYGSVLWFPNEKKFKCWYLALNIYDSRPGFRGYRKEHHLPIHEAAFICSAESKDGVAWTKPELGLHEFRGS